MKFFKRQLDFSKEKSNAHPNEYYAELTYRLAKYVGAKVKLISLPAFSLGATMQVFKNMQYVALTNGKESNEKGFRIIASGNVCTANANPYQAFLEGFCNKTGYRLSRDYSWPSLISDCASPSELDLRLVSDGG